MKRNQKGKGNDNMETPQDLFDQLNRIFNFNFDAACTSKNSKCKNGAFFDKKMDGLNVSWRNKRVFCNPPFSQKSLWIEKAYKEVLDNDCPICVMILPTNSMDSRVWQKFIYGQCHYQIVTGRISFIDPETKKPKSGNDSGTTVVYFAKPIVS